MVSALCYNRRRQVLDYWGNVTSFVTKRNNVLVAVYLVTHHQMLIANKGKYTEQY